MTPRLEEAKRLLRLARRDQEIFHLLLPLPQANLAVLGLHAQQTTERSLKAIATLRDIEVRRTHDLAAIATCEGAPAAWRQAFKMFGANALDSGALTQGLASFCFTRPSRLAGVTMSMQR